MPDVGPFVCWQKLKSRRLYSPRLFFENNRLTNALFNTPQCDRVFSNYCRR
jgi:hypothetical protein